jgi:DNA polymerase (family X)
MENLSVAEILNQVADILEITDGNQYKMRAYRIAALNIENLSQQIEDIYKEDKKKLQEIPGVGEGIAGKIEEIIETGKLKKHQKLLKVIPLQLLELMEITGIGPKHLKALHKKLKVKNVKDLERACKKHKIQELEGFGERTEKKILDALKEYQRSKGRMKLPEALSYASSIIDYLKKGRVKIDAIEIAGSLRRGMETIGDLDILVSTKETDRIMDKFTAYPERKNVLSKGKTKSSVVLKSGFQADLRNIQKSRFGSALVYFTGSKEHNIHIRRIAKSKGLKISEYGVFKGKKNIASKTEEDVYKAIGLKIIIPELREDRGEIEAAGRNELPKVIELKDIKGDLHMHTEASDGFHAIKDMAREGKRKKYEYIAITEHSKAVQVAGGLNEKDLSKHIKRIEKEDGKVKGIKILKGIEVDIKEDGGLDLDDSILRELDLVIGAVHSRFNMPKDKMTERILKAFDNKYLNILAHPSCRLIGKRKPCEIDFERIFKEAKKRNIIMELNCFPDRLDLKDVYCKMAKEIGIKIIISTDAHSRQQLDNMKYGVITARRGWLEKKDIINTFKLERLIKMIKRR